MMRIGKIFAHNLKKNRQTRGFSQEKLAESLNVSTHHIAMIETARSYPALQLVERIATVLDMEIYELFLSPASAPDEMERLYQTVAKNIENVVSEAIEKALANKYPSKL